jgi:hypothetical protein
VSVLSAFDRFAALPRRLFLDSSTLQTILRYGEYIWENVEPPFGDRAYQMAGFVNDLDALRMIFQVNQRAMFDIVVSRNTLQEVRAKGDPSYDRACEVLDHWYTRVDEYQGRAFSGDGAALAARLDSRSIDYLSKEDKLLLQDALALECDAFLTMEKKLSKNAAHLRAVTGLQILRPPGYWQLLEPWAALYL